MNQVEYEQIIECIKFGSPAYAGKLISAFNGAVQLAVKAQAQAQAAKANEVNDGTINEESAEPVAKED